VLFKCPSCDAMKRSIKDNLDPAEAVTAKALCPDCYRNEVIAAEALGPDCYRCKNVNTVVFYNKRGEEILTENAGRLGSDNE